MSEPSEGFFGNADSSDGHVRNGLSGRGDRHRDGHCRVFHSATRPSPGLPFFIRRKFRVRITYVNALKYTRNLGVLNSSLPKSGPGDWSAALWASVANTDRPMAAFVPASVAVEIKECGIPTPLGMTHHPHSSALFNDGPAEGPESAPFNSDVKQFLLCRIKWEEGRPIRYRAGSVLGRSESWPWDVSVNALIDGGSDGRILVTRRFIIEAPEKEGTPPVVGWMAKAGAGAHRVKVAEWPETGPRGGWTDDDG